MNTLWGLDKSIFTVHEGKVLRGISIFKAEEVPFSMGIIIDTSGSMAMDNARISLPFNAVTEGLSSLLDVSPASSDYFLMRFDENPELLVDWTSDKRALIEKVTSFEPKGLTSLYRAARLGLGNDPFVGEKH